eukprot:CAMPEP_0113404990 /NCGR_PEP_ID=MMETSP0013_2-20120614/18701_1 /TAXON_ID=2843 ORGANISM="Skeletonema costatum, Strain 1716" /NCGR_SAMPLE_ID=MMETSP0013_2 /ASSEMBLY_ACC=CAM_ASM_000158 /LENGTH=460 /DNA_ID=CAMNT_0000290663 /DNA_START=91 /DNA_END=1473 /DNA_ORIENTATION=+ /assembly_acc=CAM_ASM_000158
MPHVEIPQAEFKLVILGDANCGKTSLITRFTQGYYRQHPNTNTSTTKTNSPPSSSSLILRNPNFVTKSIPVTSSNIPTKIQIWDVAGPTSNNNSKSTNNSKSSVKGAHTAAKCYYSTSSAILLGYDVTSRSSYEEMRLWLNELRTSVHFHVVVVAIVALKTDLLHGTHHHHYHGNNEYNSNTSEAVPEYEVEQLAQALNVMYIPTSSKLDVNVTSLFQRVAEEVLVRRKRGVVAGMQAGDYGYSNNGRQLKKNGGLGGGGLGGRYHSSGNGSGGGNNDTTRPSSPVSSKDLYGKYYENDGKKKNSNGNSNNNVDSNHDHRDDSNTSSSMMLPNDIMNGNNSSTHNNNDNDAMSTPSDKKKSNHKRRRSSNKPQQHKESSTSTSSTTTAEGCAGSVGAMISACTDADLKDGNGENKYDITMRDEEDDVVHKNGEEDGENTGSFFMMCGPTTWCGNTADTID